MSELPSHNVCASFKIVYGRSGEGIKSILIARGEIYYQITCDTYSEMNLAWIVQFSVFQNLVNSSIFFCLLRNQNSADMVVLTHSPHTC